MNTQQKAAAIESKVREVCPELTERYCTSGVGCKHDNEGGHEGTCVWKSVYGEIHLEHLLRTIEKKLGSDGFGLFATNGWVHYNSMRTRYDYSKSFSENIENNELTDFLYKLICE